MLIYRTYLVYQSIGLPVKKNTENKLLTPTLILPPQEGGDVEV